jgi:hypothetical protein
MRSHCDNKLTHELGGLAGLKRFAMCEHVGEAPRIARGSKSEWWRPHASWLQSACWRGRAS